MFHVTLGSDLRVISVKLFFIDAYITIILHICILFYFSLSAMCGSPRPMT